MNRTYTPKRTAGRCALAAVLLLTGTQNWQPANAQNTIHINDEYLNSFYSSGLTYYRRDDCINAAISLNTYITLATMARPVADSWRQQVNEAIWYCMARLQRAVAIQSQLDRTGRVVTVTVDVQGSADGPPDLRSVPFAYPAIRQPPRRALPISPPQ